MDVFETAGKTPKFFSIYCVKDFRQIHDRSVQEGPQMLTLLLQLADVEDHIGGLTMTTKAEIASQKERLLRMVVQAVQKNEIENLSGSVKQGVTSMMANRKSSHDVVPDGKGNTRITSPCPGATTPTEGVDGTHILLLALVGESGLPECGDVHLVARQFPGH
ncbi:hypothetical protein SprV_0301132300 [Sparganum proliferum]